MTIYTSVKPEDLKPGDEVRIAEKYEGVSVTYEGWVIKINSDLAWFGRGGEAVAAYIENKSGVTVTVERKFELPTKVGTVVEIEDSVMAELVRLNQRGEWHFVASNAPITHDTVASCYVRTVWAPK